MIIDVQVTRVEEARSGIAANGLPYCRRTIVVAFQEGSNDGQVINQALAVDLSGEDAQRNYVQFQQLTIEVRFNVSAYRDKIYLNARATIVQPQQQVPQSAAPQTPSMFNR